MEDTNELPKEGKNSEDLTNHTIPVNIDSTDYDNFSDIDEWEDFESFLSDSDLDHG